jgi:hypothetical protein
METLCEDEGMSIFFFFFFGEQKKGSGWTKNLAKQRARAKNARYQVQTPFQYCFLNFYLFLKTIKS